MSSTTVFFQSQVHFSVSPGFSQTFLKKQPVSRNQRTQVGLESAAKIHDWPSARRTGEGCFRRLLAQHSKESLNHVVELELKRASNNVHHDLDVINTRVHDHTEEIIRRESYQQNHKIDESIAGVLERNKALCAKIYIERNKLANVIQEYEEEKAHHVHMGRNNFTHLLKEYLGSSNSNKLCEGNDQDEDMMGSERWRQNYRPVVQQYAVNFDPAMYYHKKDESSWSEPVQPQLEVEHAQLQQQQQQQQDSWTKDDLWFCVLSFIMALSGTQIFTAIAQRGGIQDLVYFSLYSLLLLIPAQFLLADKDSPVVSSDSI